MSHSTHDVMNQFKNAMYDRIGYAPETIIGDGYLHRVKDGNFQSSCRLDG